jgi:glutamate dehydrogenase
MAAPDIILVADRAEAEVEAVTGVYFAADAFFQVDRIVAAAREIELADHFDRLALDRALAELASSQRAIAAEALSTGKRGEDAVLAWVALRGREIVRARSDVHEIAASGLTLSKLAVAVGLLSALAKS